MSGRFTSVPQGVAGEHHAPAREVQRHRAGGHRRGVQHPDLVTGHGDALPVVESPVLPLPVHRLPQVVVARMQQDRGTQPYAHLDRRRDVGSASLGADHCRDTPVTDYTGDIDGPTARIDNHHISVVADHPDVRLAMLGQERPGAL